MDVLSPGTLPSNVSKGAWTAVWTPGVNLANFFNLYDSKGDVTISVATSIANNLDGPIQVARWGAATINAQLTLAQRGRGFIPLFGSLSVGAAGSITMTARGAAGSPKWATDKDIFVPKSITFTGKNTSYADFLQWIRQTGYCIFDPSLYACPPPGMGDVQCDWATWTPYGGTIVSSAGCGAAPLAAVNTGSSAVGVAGNAGTLAPGSGSSGAVYWSVGFPGGAGRPWGGGVGSGSRCNGKGDGTPADNYGGPAGNGSSYVDAPTSGGAGNPPGTGIGGGTGAAGTGGVLLCFVSHDVSLTAGHVMSANGSQGGASATGACGGSSAGGRVALYCGGTTTGTPNLTATGGPAATGSVNGAAGGAGTTTASTFTAMGWAA